MTDTEKIQNLTALLLEIEKVYIDRSALPDLADHLSPLLKKWNRMKSHYIQKEVDFDLIRDVVCDVCGITQEAFLYSLNRNHADARKMFVGLALSDGGVKLEAIGNYLNGRDHSTVILAKRRHLQLLQGNDKYRALFLKAAKTCNERGQEIEVRPTQGGKFKKCCAEHIRAFYVNQGTLHVWGNTACPACNQYIGFSPSSPEYVDSFLTSFGLEPLFKSKQIEGRAEPDIFEGDSLNLLQKLKEKRWTLAHEGDRFNFFKPPASMGFDPGYNFPFPIRVNAPDYKEYLQHSMYCFARFYNQFPEDFYQ